MVPGLWLGWSGEENINSSAGAKGMYCEINNFMYSIFFKNCLFSYLSNLKVYVFCNKYPFLVRHSLHLKTCSEPQIRCVKWISIDTNSYISWPNPMFDHLVESSRWDNFNKWSNIGFGPEIDVLEMKICTLSGALMLYIYVTSVLFLSATV